ncbi:LysE family transporter [Frankia sp. CN7]|uniref:LysE family transporter n=2 Tax=Frankia nepalensis TaxID=1836974 RepID=A0A937RBH7_9ACTN|nr:LysE family transporter [Frankia nepalensis]MBL7515838.1 LysE family transporter [Frankia nepalensis]MBL7627247.1 LysE family transporter [Frankia nepalensis]
MSLFLIRSTLRGGLRTGLAIGAGIAAMDFLYAVAGAAGAAPVLSIGSLRTILGACGAAVLAVLGVRTLWSAWRVRAGGETDLEVAAPWRAFVTSLGATASNPLTIASWAALFAGASVAGVAATASGAVALVAGIGLGSLTAVSLLAAVTALTRRRLPAGAVRAVDALAGVGMVAYAGLLGSRAASEA